MTIYQSIHRVERVTLMAVEKQCYDTFVATLKIETEDDEGNHGDLEVTLFSRTAEALQVRRD